MNVHCLHSFRATSSKVSLWFSLSLITGLDVTTILNRASCLWVQWEIEKRIAVWLEQLLEGNSPIFYHCWLIEFTFLLCIEEPPAMGKQVQREKNEVKSCVKSCFGYSKVIVFMTCMYKFLWIFYSFIVPLSIFSHLVITVILRK